MLNAIIEYLETEGLGDLVNELGMYEENLILAYEEMAGVDGVARALQNRYFEDMYLYSSMKDFEVYADDLLCEGLGVRSDDHLADYIDYKSYAQDLLKHGYYYESDYGILDTRGY